MGRGRPLKSFIFVTSMGAGCLILILAIAISTPVSWCLVREFSAMIMEMFQGCAGTGFYWLGGVGCFIFRTFMSWLLSIISI